MRYSKLWKDTPKRLRSSKWLSMAASSATLYWLLASATKCCNSSTECRLVTDCVDAEGEARLVVTHTDGSHWKASAPAFGEWASLLEHVSIAGLTSTTSRQDQQPSRSKSRRGHRC